MQPFRRVVDGPIRPRITRAVRSVLELPEPEREALRRRLGAIVESSSGIGWGYHDGLCDEYYEAFPDDE